VIRVAVAGAGGRMGQEVCGAVVASDDLELVAAIDQRVAGEGVRSMVGPAAPELTVADTVDAAADAGAAVLVDFTEAAAAAAHLQWCASHGVHAVVGTTGLSAEDLGAARAAFEVSEANALIAPNFAIGAVLLLRFCELAAPFMAGAEIIELHHDKKRDAPSGTALQTAERIAAARRAAGTGDDASDPTTQHVLAGVRGGKGPGGIRVHSVRLPGLVAHEEVVFGAVGQSLTLRHDAYDRSSFMPGVLLAIRGVADRPGLTVGLDELLGI
jgi:4-hydroxy-tetrahydrodipicolinate reductase